jgi:hypothetical protein
MKYDNKSIEIRIVRIIFIFIDTVDKYSNGKILKNLLNSEKNINGEIDKYLLQRMNYHFHKFNSFGKIAIIKQYHSNMKIRKQVNKYNYKLPKLKPIIIIVGLHRTGSTLLQRILDQDKHSKTLKMWELLSGPFNNDEKTKNDVNKSLKIYKNLNPKLNCIHDISYDIPDEESIILNRMISPFQNELYTYLEDVPQAERIREISKQAYPYLKKELQLYQKFSNQEFKYWVLKAPIHSLNIKELKKNFPNSILIEIKRDLKKIIPSFCNLIFQTYGPVIKGSVDKIALGTKQLQLKKKMINELYKQKFNIDYVIQYKDFIDDPIFIIEFIYKDINKINKLPYNFNNSLGEPFRSKIVEYLKESKRNKRGQTSTYSLEEFGLTHSDIEAIPEHVY